MDNNAKVHEIDMFNLVFIVTIIISISKIYINNVQKDDLIHNRNHFEEIKSMRLFLNAVFSMVFLYVTYVSWKNLVSSKGTSKKEYESNFYDFVASMLILIGSIVSIYSVYLQVSEQEVEFAP